MKSTIKMMPSSFHWKEVDGLESSSFPTFPRLPGMIPQPATWKPGFQPQNFPGSGKNPGWRLELKKCCPVSSRGGGGRVNGVVWWRRER